MEMVYLRAEICGELPSGQKRVKILANNADGIQFYTEEKCIIRHENFEEEINPWIPVTERLPEGNTEVLTYRESGVDVERHLRTCWDYDDISDYPVTHWKPLPAPPKEGV